MEARTVLMQEPRLSTACSDPGNILYRGERVNNKATGLENCLYGTVNYLVQIDHAVTVVCRHDRCDQDFFILCVCVCVLCVRACVLACVHAVFAWMSLNCARRHYTCGMTTMDPSSSTPRCSGSQVPVLWFSLA